MEKGGVSMDAASQDMWDWEVLPDHMSSSISSHGGGHAQSFLGDQETEESNLDTGADMAVDECKDIGVDVPAKTETKTSQEESPMAANATELPASDGAEEEDAFQSSDAKVVDDAADDDAGGEEEEEGGGEGKKGSSRGKARPECVVFSVGKLRVNGIGALCSFGVAAATVCIFLVGGRLQHHHRLQQQQQKIQLQLYGDDKRMQQVVQQTSRLNQAMSSVMGGGGSTRANISFGGYYEGF